MACTNVNTVLYHACYSWRGTVTLFSMGRTGCLRHWQDSNISNPCELCCKAMRLPNSQAPMTKGTVPAIAPAQICQPTSTGPGVYEDTAVSTAPQLPGIPVRQQVQPCESFHNFCISCGVARELVGIWKSFSSFGLQAATCKPAGFMC